MARTIITLVQNPGRLTLEFLAGRRVRYLSPLRLYLSLSVLFFLCSALSTRLGSSNPAGIIRFDTSGKPGSVRNVITFDTTALEPAPTGSPAESTAIKPRSVTGLTIDTSHGNALTRSLRRRMSNRAAYMQEHRAEASARVSEAFQHDLPDALFLLIPGLAFALWVLYHGAHRSFAEHVVFALHFQAFAFAALTVGLLPVPFLSTITGIAILVYLFLALRKVYGQSIGSTTGKFAAIVIGYGISLAAVLTVVAFTVFLFA